MTYSVAGLYDKVSRRNIEPARQSVFNFDFFVLVPVSASRHCFLSSQSRSTTCKLGNLAFDESIVYSSALACGTVLPPRYRRRYSHSVEYPLPQSAVWFPPPNFRRSRKPIRIDSQYSKINQRQATSKSVHFGSPHLNRCRMFASVVRFFERKYMHELPFSASRVPFHIDCILASPISILRLRELYNQIENMNQKIVL